MKHDHLERQARKVAAAQGTDRRRPNASYYGDNSEQSRGLSANAAATLFGHRGPPASLLE